MTIVPPPRVGVIICDDLPEAYVRFLYGNRIDRAAVVFSRSDAMRAAEAEPRGNGYSKQYHPHGRPHCGRAGRIGEPR